MEFISRMRQFYALWRQRIKAAFASMLLHGQAWRINPISEIMELPGYAGVFREPCSNEKRNTASDCTSVTGCAFWPGKFTSTGMPLTAISDWGDHSDSGQQDATEV
jgi:hypothetical protein